MESFCIFVLIPNSNRLLTAIHISLSYDLNAKPKKHLIDKKGVWRKSTKETNGFIEVTFQDTGIGIKKENISKIFTPFFTTKAQGMGVGLSICKRFVEIHDGSIEVESEEGEGSIFTVKLPIQRNGGVKLD